MSKLQFTGSTSFEEKYDEKLSYTLTMKFKSDKVMVIVSWLRIGGGP